MNFIADTLKYLEVAEKKKLFLIATINTVLALADIVFLAFLIYFISFFPDKLNDSSIPESLLVNNGVPFFCVFVMLFLSKNMLSVFMLKQQYQSILGIASRISRLNASNYLHGDFNEFVQKDSSSIITRIIQHPSEYALQIIFPLQQIITETVIIAATITAILIYNTQVFFALVLLLLPIVLITSRSVKSSLKKTRESIVNDRDVTLQYLNEALKSYVEANIYQKQSFFVDRYAVKQHQLNSQIANLHFLQSISPKLIENFAVIGLMILILLNTIFATDETNMLVPIGAFLAASYKLVPGAIKLTNLLAQVSIHRSILQHLIIPRIEKIDFTNEEIDSLEFKNIGVSYNNKSIIENFNASIKPGRMVGLKARSGRGKTTLLNVLLGFVNESTGEILINNKSINHTERRKVWTRISYVQQENFLIHDTLLKNVLFDTDLSVTRLNDISNATDLSSFVNTLSQKWDTIITENGKNISGGQKQRIAIARALYKEADLYILDEPFNELDKDSERKLIQHFKQLSAAGKTVILVTHDEESLLQCDDIIEMNG